MIRFPFPVWRLQCGDFYCRETGNIMLTKHKILL